MLELLELGLAEVVDEARADRVAQYVDRRPEPKRALSRNLCHVL